MDVSFIRDGSFKFQVLFNVNSTLDCVHCFQLTWTTAMVVKLWGGFLSLAIGTVAKCMPLCALLLY